jgi:hypothetical protein
VHSQHLVKNRILRQLLASELKSIQPWLTLVQLRRPDRADAGFCRSAHRTVGGSGGIGASVAMCLLIVSRGGPAVGSMPKNSASQPGFR